MKFYIENTSSYDLSCFDYKGILLKFNYEEIIDNDGRLRSIIELNSLEDLNILCKLVNYELIVDFRCEFPFIEIYDDYRE